MRDEPRGRPLSTGMPATPAAFRTGDVPLPSEIDHGFPRTWSSPRGPDDEMTLCSSLFVRPLPARSFVNRDMGSHPVQTVENQRLRTQWTSKNTFPNLISLQDGTLRLGIACELTILLGCFPVLSLLGRFHGETSFRWVPEAPLAENVPQRATYAGRYSVLSERRRLKNLTRREQKGALNLRPRHSSGETTIIPRERPRQ